MVHTLESVCGIENTKGENTEISPAFCFLQAESGIISEKNCPNLELAAAGNAILLV
jgi:hypothetical protein